MQMSESIASLAVALTAFEAEVQNPHNTASNPFHKNKYAPLQDILRDVRPLLAKHGLAVTQPVHSECNAIGVTTMLVHTSGEYIADTVTMEPGSEKGKSAAQLAGSVITYLRRYSLASVLGIASEDDDDGNAGLRNNGNAQHDTAKPDAAKLKAAYETTEQAIKEIWSDSQRKMYIDELSKAFTDRDIDAIRGIYKRVKQAKDAARADDLDKQADKAFNNTDAERSEAENNVPEEKPEELF
jgi:hypothetical protein